MKKISMIFIGCIFMSALSPKMATAQNGLPYWSLAGNSNASATSKLGTTNNRSLRFFTNNKQRMIINSDNGSVGIGIATPESKLQVNSALGQNAFRAQVNGTTKFIVDNLGGVSVGSASSPPANGLYVTGIAGIRGAANSAYALTVNASSLFGGINITDPVHGSVLYCKKSGILSGIFIEKTASGTGTACITGNSTGSSPGLGGFSTNGEGVKAISTNNSGVYGESTIGYGIYGLSKSGGGILATSTDSYGGTFSSTNSFGLYASTVNGSYAAYFNGAVFSTVGYTPSDKNLKKNIEELTNAMDIVKLLKPKHYDYRNDGKYALMKLPTGKHYGLIAQELEEVLPDLVKETTQQIVVPKQPVIKKSFEGNELISTIVPQKDEQESITIKAVNYTELIPIMVKGMQEMDRMNQDLKEENKVIRQELTELRQMLIDLKSSKITDNGTAAIAFLRQNNPNPARGNTLINYRVPVTATSANVTFTNIKGQLIKAITISNMGEGQVNFNTSTLAAGAYNYTLWVDGKQLDTKQLLIAK